MKAALFLALGLGCLQARAQAVHNEMQKELKDLHMRSQVVASSPTKAADPTEKQLTLEDDKASKGLTALNITINNPKKGLIRRITPQASGISASLEGDDAFQTQRQTRFGAGLTVEVGQEHFIFQTGLMYYQFGAQYKNTTTEVISTWDLNYVTIPLIGKYYFARDTRSSMFLQAGGFGSVLTSSSYSSRSTSSIYRTVLPLKANDYDYGGIVGFGGKMNVTDSMSLMLEANYLRGLAPVIRDNSIYNSAIIVGGGISIEI